MICPAWCEKCSATWNAASNPVTWILLSRVNPYQIIGRKLVQNVARFHHRFLQALGQCLPLQRAPLAELLVSLASVGCAAQARDNPLTNIALQVQHQVSHTVGSFIGAPPNLLE